MYTPGRSPFVAAVLALCVLLLTAAPCFAQSRAAQPDPFAKDFRPDTILVMPVPGAAPASVAALHAASGAAVLKTFPRFGNLQVLRLPAALSVQQALAIYQRHPLVQFAEPDYIYQVIEAQNIPNDLVADLWGMHNTGQSGGTADADIDAPEAWSLRTDASSIIVGVIDTGIDYTHPDLAPNLWVNPGEIAGNGIDDDGNGFIDDVYGINGIAGAANPGNPMDDQASTYHGTHVSGTIGAAGNNGLGVVGVAWRVKLMGLKFLNSSGSGNSSDAITCIDYAIAKGARVLSNSWGGGGYSQSLYDAINRARTAGIIFVAAAGNSNADTDATAFYPAGYNLPNVVSVASTDRYDLRSSFSNYGYRTVELGAPGSSIYSTKAGNSYQSLSGTSMATPHVSGAFALMAAQFPALSATELIQRVLLATDPIPSLASVTITGGRLNLFKALSGLSRPIPHFTASPVSGEPGVTITFTDSSLGNISTRTLDFGDGSAPVNFSGTATHSYANLGTYTATLTVTGPDGTATRSQTIYVQPNYTAATDTFQWVDTSAMTAVTLTDDSSSGAVTLPFTFPLYGQNFTTLYIGSNGLVTFGSNAGATSFSNSAIPSTATPNAALYPFWDDLNPAGLATAAIRHGRAADGNYVVSWEGVPVYGNPLPLSFQIVLAPSGVVRFQYLEVQPANGTYGAGRSATVGIESATGTIARQYAYLGSTLLANNTAIRFSMSADSTPVAPSALSAAAASGTQINLSWTDNSSNESGFRVERSTDNVTFSEIATTGAGVATYSATGLTAGQLYYFRVRAYNGAGNSAYSNTASATTLAPPAAPSGLSATPVSGTQINLSWTDNSSNESGFRVERSTDNVTFSEIATTGAGVATYSATGLTAGQLYYFRVRAYNAVGNSAYSGTASATTLLPPNAPTGLSATANSATQITLAWTDAANNETGYRVYRSTDNLNFTLIATLAANAASYVNTGLTGGTTYYYRVSSYGAGGESSFATASTTTPAGPPAAPSALKATATSKTQIDLTWADNSSNETNFVVEYLVGKTYVQLVALGSNVTSYSNSGLSAGTKRTYRVKAVNVAGSSAYSNTASATTLRR